MLFIHKFCLSIASDRTERTTLKSDRISFCQKVVMLRLNVITLSLNVVTLSLNLMMLVINVVMLRLNVVTLSLNLVTLRLNVVMLMTTRHSLITAIVDSRTNKFSLGNFLGDIDSGK